MSFWERIVGPDTVVRIDQVFGRLSGLFARQDVGGDADQSQTHYQVAFTIAVVALGAKMAKADGLVTPDEVAAFKQVFTVAASDMVHVGRVFALARADTAGFEAYAQQLARLFTNNKQLLGDVLDGLFHVASADGVLHPAEDQYLGEIARLFGFSLSEYLYVRSHFVNASDIDPLHVLGLTPQTDTDTLKATYRRLVAENHPDRYIARGMPAEAVEIANRKLAAINEAYATIARERGIK